LAAAELLSRADAAIEHAEKLRRRAQQLQRHYPEVVAALCKTLELERAEIISPRDPVMNQLKAAILRVIAQ